MPNKPKQRSKAAAKRVAATAPPLVNVPDEAVPSRKPAKPQKPAAKSAKKTPSAVPAKPAVDDIDSNRQQPAAEQRHAAPAVDSDRPAASRRVWIIGAMLALALLAGALGLVWHRHQSDDPQRLTAINRDLVAEVSQRAVLPQGESPTITTVVDKNKVNQGFLSGAANGDKVLLYFQAGRAVLYRPSTHQVVNIGPLTQPPARVFLRDGTSAAIPPAFRSSLTQQAGFTVVSQDASARKNYTKTLVIDIAGNRPDLAKRAATLVGGQVAQLPGGESRPDADILIIVGADTK